MLPSSPTSQIAKDISDIKKRLIAIESQEPRGDWGHVVANILALPELRGCWNMQRAYTGAGAALLVTDMSSTERHLTRNNAPTFLKQQQDDFPEIPFARFDGATEWLSRTDEAGLDILADLTIFGWFRFHDATPAATEQFIGKHGAGADRAYRLARTAAGVVSFQIFDGAVVTTAIAGNVTDDNVWKFIAGTFDPSVKMRAFLNDVATDTVAAVPAAINNSASDFAIGARTGGALYLDGDAALCGLCAAVLDNDTIFAIFESSRKFFGV